MFSAVDCYVADVSHMVTYFQAHYSFSLNVSPSASHANPATELTHDCLFFVDGWSHLTDSSELVRFL